MHATAIFQTTDAKRHLDALCRHFARKVDATVCDGNGHVAFAFGSCVLVADETALTLKAQAPDRSRLNKVIDAVSRHLDRFAFRENPKLNWSILADEPST